jgi:hypothetical protein
LFQNAAKYFGSWFRDSAFLTLSFSGLLWLLAHKFKRMCCGLVLALNEPALPPSSTKGEVKSPIKLIRVRSSVMMQQMEVARQRRQQKLELFETIKQMRAAGLKVTLIARQLGLCRWRIDKWIRFDELPERNRMQPHPVMPESFRDYLRQRWDAGGRHGRTLFAEIRFLSAFGV